MIYLQKVMTIFILVKYFQFVGIIKVIVWDQLHYLLDPLTNDHTIQRLAQKTKHKLVNGGMQENTQQNRM